MPAAERRRRIVLDPELNGLCGLLACDLRDHAQAKIDTRRHSARRDNVAILDDPRLLVCRPDRRQEFREGPVRSRPAPAQYPRGAEYEGAGTHRRDVFRLACLAADELDRLLIADGGDDAEPSAGHADQIERRAVGKGVRRYEAEPAVARYRFARFGDDVDSRLRKQRQHLQRSGEIELRQIRKNDESDLEGRHAWSPLVLKRERNSVGEAAIVRANTRSLLRSDPTTPLRWSPMLSLRRAR